MDYSNNPRYSARVQQLEAEGLTTSDAQGLADMEFDPHFKKSVSMEGWRGYQQICKHKWYLPYVNETRQRCAVCGLDKDSQNN